MTYNDREFSGYFGEPFELYLFQTETKSWRMTSAAQAITFAGEVYVPAAIIRTETSQGAELESGTIKITIPKDHQLAGEFVGSVPSTPMSVVIYRGHLGEDDDSQVITHFTGGVKTALFTDVCELTAVPESEILKKQIPAELYQSQCNHILYDLGCKVNREDFRINATITSVDGDTITATAFASEPDGWWITGYIEKGTNRRMVINHSGNTVVLLVPMNELQTGDVISIYAGCNRDSITCGTKFNNLVNFFGFEQIPNRNPFNGGLQ